MILYNITYNIDNDIKKDWLEWMKAVHIPKIMSTGYFDSVRLFRLLNVTEEGYTFSLQFMTDSLNKIEAYLEESAGILAEEHNRRYANRHVAFRTVLEEINI